MRKCPKCNMESAAENANNYCRFCGVKMVEVPEIFLQCSNSECHMRTKKRRYWKEDVKFCGECGSPVVEVTE